MGGLTGSLFFLLFDYYLKYSRSLNYTDDNSEESEKLAFVCSCAVDAVKTGGSVLIPMNRIGILLQLLEQISASLDSSNLKVTILTIEADLYLTLALVILLGDCFCWMLNL